MVHPEVAQPVFLKKATCILVIDETPMTPFPFRVTTRGTMVP